MHPSTHSVLHQFDSSSNQVVFCFFQSTFHPSIETVRLENIDGHETQFMVQVGRRSRFDSPSLRMDSSSFGMFGIWESGSVHIGMCGVVFRSVPSMCVRSMKQRTKTILQRLPIVFPVSVSLGLVPVHSQLFGTKYMFVGAHEGLFFKSF